MRFAPLALILGALACLVALLASRRRVRWRGVLAAPDIPSRIDREAFARLDASAKPWLVAVLTDSACGTCNSALERLSPVAGPTVEVVEVDADGHRELHDAYGVDAVPFTLVADRDGAVQTWILGPPTPSDIASVQRVVAEQD
ncbi:MAG: thioredoxin family protein [bacterium]|nr:thioredoxin family protein [bacterium]